ncbi:MAG: alkaline phosphatase family protein [Chitinophagales bacterium]|nr:alkaline phosphatase family protein [Chitinophagales bacterium]
MKKYIFAFFATYLLSFTLAQHSTTIGLLGCHVQGRPAPSIEFFADVLQPDYAVWLGDNVYADTESDPQYIQDQLNVLAQKPGFQKLKANTPFFVTWDDHDFGLNGSDKNYIFKEESKEIHRKFWELETKVPEERDGVYYDEVIHLENGKSLQFIMLDGRFNHDSKNTLGANQWAWLETVLEKKVDLRFIVCGYQVLLPHMTRWESWAKTGKERKRLFKLIEKTQANNILFLTGDQHTTEVLRSQKKLNYFSYEIMACGINQTERPGRAPNRVLGPDLTLNSSPLIEIIWEEKDAQILFKNYNADTQEVVSSFTFRLSDIGPKH